MKNAKDKKGFTLVELVVILVILAILMAILVPALIGYINKSKKTGCDVNINYTYKALLAEYVEQYAKGQDGLTEDDIKKVMTKDMEGTANGKGYADICPSGGIYTVEADKNNFTITCSVHGEGENTLPPTADSKVNDIMNHPKVQNYFLTAKPSIPKLSLDSTGPNFGAEAKEEIASTLGLDPNSFDFRIYREGTSSTTDYRVYISPNLTNYNTGDNIDVTGYKYTYNAAAKNWTLTETGTVQTVTVKDAETDGKHYKVINAGKYHWPT